MKNYYTFELFFWKFHEINPGYKLRKSDCRKIFENINCNGKRKAIIKGIEKTKLSCIDYLRSCISV